MGVLIHKKQGGFIHFNEKISGAAWQKGMEILIRHNVPKSKIFGQPPKIELSLCNENKSTEGRETAVIKKKIEVFCSLSGYESGFSRLKERSVLHEARLQH